jgi:hypothetical protein
MMDDDELVTADSPGTHSNVSWSLLLTVLEQQHWQGTECSEAKLNYQNVTWA